MIVHVCSSCASRVCINKYRATGWQIFIPLSDNNICNLGDTYIQLHNFCCFVCVCCMFMCMCVGIIKVDIAIPRVDNGDLLLAILCACSV